MLRSAEVLLGLSWLCCAYVPSAYAADFSHFTSAEGREIVSLTGEIQQGDADQLSSIVRAVNARSILVSGVRLNSPGGNLLEGAKLASAIKGFQIATVVMRGTVCASACFVAFAAGSEKYVSYGARVGVHGASLAGQTGTRDAPDGTVAMAKLVKELGVPPGIIGQMVVTPYSDIVWLSPADLQSMSVQMTGTPGEPAVETALPNPVSTASATMPDRGEADPVSLRRAVAPLIRALTDCVAQHAIQDSGATSAYRDGQGAFAAYLTQSISTCSDPLGQLLATYDRMDGVGRGRAFVKGPYADDLLRAVLKRVRSTMDDRLAALNRDLAEQATREAQEKVAAEAERQARAAEAEQRAAQARAAAIQAEVDARVAQSRAQEARHAQADQARQTMALLSNRAEQCVRHELENLVKSGEAAETLTSAVMILCKRDVTAMLESAVAVAHLEQVAGSSTDDVSLLDKLRGEAHERFVVMAVQAKAGEPIAVPQDSEAPRTVPSVQIKPRASRVIPSPDALARLLDQDADAVHRSSPENAHGLETWHILSPEPVDR